MNCSPENLRDQVLEVTRSSDSPVDTIVTFTTEDLVLKTAQLLDLNYLTMRTSDRYSDGSDSDGFTHRSNSWESSKGIFIGKRNLEPGPEVLAFKERLVVIVSELWLP